uniref:uncharacterized protein LOC120338147 n=1 Tax=Styela clava TaxID=7725 RepID=UPI0019398B9B|nr:uncharacterized protein LOC120338147 [Styela clava]
MLLALRISLSESGLILLIAHIVTRCHCSVQINPECSHENPVCLNGGTMDSNGICQCTPEWKGDFCDIAVKVSLYCRKSNECKYGGSCIDGKCQCTNLRTGRQCQINVQDTVKYIEDILDKKTQSRYFFISTNAAFSRARNQCRKLGGHIITATEPISSHDNEFDGSLSFSLPHKTKNCSAIKLNNFGALEISCYGKMAYVCQAPTTGVCSKAIQSKFCDNTIAGHCHHSKTGFECCKRGFKMMENGICVDRNSILCPPKDENCVYKNGSSVCLCPDNMQGNGINACGYIITLWQIVRYPEIKLPATDCAVRDKANRLRDLYSKHLLNKINMLIITKITDFETKLLNLTYDIYCSDPNLTPRDFIKDFIKVRRAMRSSNKKLFFGWRKPIQASSKCTPKEMGYGKRLYHFKAAKAGTLAFSKENSSSGSSEATLPCKIRKYSDGSESAYLDYTAFRFACNMIYTTSAPISFETTNGDVANGSTLMYRFKKYYNETMHDSVNTTNDFRSAKVVK